MRQPLIDLVEKAYLKPKPPKFNIGDTVDVHTRIVEGDKERIQIFNGVVIARRGSGINEKFTVRRIVANEGVERTFMVHSPNVVKVVTKRRGKARRAKLYLAPQPLNNSEQRALTNWNDRIWTNMDAWASRDPLHQKLITALKISYHQSQVRLEDYYMDRGFNTEEAEGLALATLESLVGYHLERFI